MAFESGFKWDETFQAGADLSAAQFLWVKGQGTTAETVVACSVLGEDGIGVLQNNPKVGQDCTVRLLGYTKAIAGGIIANWAQVTTDAAGKTITAATGHKILGVAINGTAAANEFATVWVRSEPAVV